MGVIGANHLETRGAGLADGGKVVGRLDLEFRPAALEISCPCRILHDVGTANEQPAALVRQLFDGVRDDPRDDILPDLHATSTIMAVPIPPPMHSDAAPRPPPRA